MFALTTLNSGLQLATAHLPWARGVAVELMLETGSRDEAPGQGGAAHFLEHMLFKGTTRRPRPIDLTAPLEAVGASVNAFTSQETTVIELHGPRATLPQLLDAALDMACAPRFDPAEFEREREVILEEIAGYNDDPAEVCAELLPQALWGQHPLALPITGTETSVSNLQLAQLQAFHAQGYQPQKAVLALAGNLEGLDLPQLIQQIPSPWPSAPTQPNNPNTVSASTEQNPPHTPTRRHQQRAELQQVHLGLSWNAPAALEPRRYTTRFAIAALAETMSSRLFQQLREERGLVYSLSGEYLAFRDRGTTQLYLEAEPNKMRQALDYLETELSQLSRDGFTQTETETTRGYLLGQVDLAFDSPPRIAHWLAESARLENRVPQPQQAQSAYQTIQPQHLASELKNWRKLGTAEAAIGPKSI